VCRQLLQSELDYLKISVRVIGTENTGAGVIHEWYAEGPRLERSMYYKVHDRSAFAEVLSRRAYVR
jgi:hypothetical protein